MLESLFTLFLAGMLAAAAAHILLHHLGISESSRAEFKRLLELLNWDSREISEAACPIAQSALPLSIRSCLPTGAAQPPLTLFEHLHTYE